MADDQRGIPKWLWPAWAVIAFVAGAAALTSWLRQLPDTKDSVAVQWANAAQAYGFEPVYPPQEDFYVGDVFAVIIADAAADILHEPLPTRAIKIDHLDLTDEIEKEYGAGYRFPLNVDPPDKEEKIWTQTEAAASVFARSGTLKSLPVALLPDFTITAKRQAKFDLDGLFDLAAALGYSGAHERQTSFKVKGVLTYGVNATQAELKLHDFCTDRTSRAFCTDRGLRQQLRNILGAAIDDPWTDPQTGNTIKRYTVELSVVTRVYLVRSLETDILDSSEAAATIKPTGGDATAKPSGGDASASADQEGSAKAHSALQTFERPLAFGYRSIRYDIDN